MSITYLDIKIHNPQNPKKSTTKHFLVDSWLGNALFEYSGKLRSSPVVFGEEDVYLLGAVTLESLGVILDPINRELKPLPMLM